MIGVFDFLCDLFLLHSPKRGGRGGRGSRVVILGSCFQILMKQPSAAVCGVESCEFLYLFTCIGMKRRVARLLYLQE